MCSVEGCDRPAITRGWCARHYTRWRRTGDPLGMLRPHQVPPPRPVRPKRERWEEHVDRTDSCWLWTGAKSSSGYGQLRTGNPGVVERAHRLAWEFYRGPIPEGLDVLHRCDNPPCCNPEHLFLGDASTNARDMVAKGRQRGGFPAEMPRPSYRSWKLDAAKVRDIRARSARGETRRSVAALYGITPASVTNIVLGRTWRRID